MVIRYGFVAALVVTLTTAQTFFNTDSCGKSLACWTFPTNCKPEECHGIVRWHVEGEKAKDLENEPGYGRYIALGISEDARMDNDTVIECVFQTEKTVNAFVSYNDHHDNVQLLEASNLVSLDRAANQDGRLMCAVTLDYGQLEQVPEGLRDAIKDVTQGAWTLIFAQGTANAKTGDKYIHAYYPWTTEELVQVCEACEQSVVVVERTFPQRARRMRR